MSGTFANPPWQTVQDGLLLKVRATPKGGRDAIDGVERLADGSPVLKARVRAAPEGGGANVALIRVIAKAAGISPSAVSLVRGQAARNKMFRLTGNPAALAAAFERTLSLKTGKTG